MTHPLTLPFSNIRATDLPLVGGKGANLGEMTDAGFPIPSGFCVTTLAFAQFMDSCGLADDLYEQLATVSADLETARRVGQHVRDTLLTVPMPPAVAEAVLAAWRTAGAESAYAVRSSATAEDLPAASFAGQQDTYLNVIGEEALLDAVRRCWVSLFTDRAILYRLQNNFAHRDVQLSVVVQQMVMSEKSGILFTADPLTGHRHTVTIDASFGLGEALVSGLVSPDAYRVDKRTMTIIERQIADKQIAIYPEKAGGVRQVDLTATQRSQTVLSDRQIIELAQLGARVEAHYGTPQDIEWAIADDTLYLLQARPITSLYPIENLQSADGSLHIYFSMGNQQMMTNVMSPLGMSGMATVLPLGKPAGEIETALLKTSGNRLFIDMTQLMRHPIFRRVVPNILSQFDALAPEMLKIATARPEFQRPSTIKLSWPAIRFGTGMMRRVQANLWWRDLTDFASSATAHLNAGIQKRQRQIDQATTPEAKIRAAIDGIGTLYEEVIFWIPTAIAGLAATKLIQRVGQGRADADALAAFDLAYAGNVVNDMNLAIGDLADLARQSPQLSALFAKLGSDSAAFLAQARQVDGSDLFFAEWERFLTQYGSRAAAEIDIRAPRWYEEPLPVLQVIASFLQKEAGSHRQQHDALVVRREAAVASLIKTAEGRWFGRIRARLLRRMLHVSQNGAVLREHHKFALVEMLRVAKEAVKEVAEQFSAAGKLADPDDVYFLRWPELLAFTQDELPNARDLIAERQAAFTQYEQMTPPAILTSDGETPVAKYRVEDAPLGALIGNPVSPGIVEGIVRVIRDPQTETLEPGDILV
ncbi:MAG: hypothetical protein KDE56_10625, partial [Anaerolineales bacterium]|nr:hypothetical protein [Anaerolineales bacterium]